VVLDFGYFMSHDLLVAACDANVCLLSLRSSTLALLPAPQYNPSSRNPSQKAVISSSICQNFTSYDNRHIHGLLSVPRATPELRIMVYSYFLPTIDCQVPFKQFCKRPFVGLRQSCRVIKNEIDHETLRLSCRLIRRANPEYALSVHGLDMCELKTVIQNQLAQPLRDFGSLNVA
jgi:hypothetical protein